MDMLIFLFAAIILLAVTVGELHRYQRVQTRAIPVLLRSRPQPQVATLDGDDPRGRS
jgi:hypothetical protein